MLSAGMAVSFLGGCASKSPPPTNAASTVQPTTLALFSPTAADPQRRAQLDAIAPALDAFFESKRKESGATGFAVAVILDGEVAYERGFGVRDVASPTP